MVSNKKKHGALNETFGQMLKYLIFNDIRPTESGERDRWTQEKLAVKLGLSDRVQIGRWVRDEVVPPTSRLNEMETLFFGKTGVVHEDLRTLFKEKHHRALVSSKLYGNSGLFAKSIVLLFWNRIEAIIEQAIDHSAFSVKAKTLEEVCWALETRLLKWEKDKVRSIASEARAYVFDVKYGGMQANEDERHVLGIEDWTKEFLALLNLLNVSFEKKLVAVGLGPGLEGKGIYENFTEFVGVDLSPSALAAALIAFPNMIVAQGEAEKLPPLAEKCDVYVSLKTYSSSFFDIEAAIRSCARCINPNGTVIISVPRGYYKGNRLIAGLAPTNYDYSSSLDGNFYGAPDRMLPISLLDRIIKSLYKWLFFDIAIHTGKHEFYITAKKV